MPKQQQIQAQFRAQQEALFNSMIEGVLVLDQAGKIQLLNQSLRDLMQLKRNIRGKTILEAFQLQELDSVAKRLLNDYTVGAVELEVPGATPKYVQVNGSAVRDQEGNPQGAIMVFHDLTRLKQLENTRQEFVANVSHELRTPLSMIKGFVETLLHGAKDDPQVATRFLQNIDKHADRLTFLIEDLLIISHLESGRLLFNMQPTNLAELACRVIDDLSVRAKEKGVKLTNQVAKEIIAHADGDRLQQVFFNLIDNAIKYGRPGEEVLINASVVDKKVIRICVSDDGPGIPPEARERVFERFYRVDKARSREQGGTGLGLSIVKHIVQRHGGRVWVESELGKGATFYFTLPMENQEGK